MAEAEEVSWLRVYELCKRRWAVEERISVFRTRLRDVRRGRRVDLDEENAFLALMREITYRKELMWNIARLKAKLNPHLFNHPQQHHQ